MESLDRFLFQLINSSLSNPLFDNIMPYLTDLHKQASFLKITLPLLLISWILQKRLSAIKIILALSLCIGCVDIIAYRVLKPIFQRERPPAVEKIINLRTNRYSGYSFPSNHAANNFAGATILSFCYPPLSPIFFSFAGLIALSRVYVGVHYPFDVIGGGLLGFFFGLLFIWLIKRFKINLY